MKIPNKSLEQQLSALGLLVTHQQYITGTACYHASPPYLQQVHISAGSMLASISLTLKEHYNQQISQILYM